MRAKAFLDLGVLAHDPFKDRETDREEEVDSEDAADDSEDDLSSTASSPDGSDETPPRYEI